MQSVVTQFPQRAEFVVPSDAVTYGGGTFIIYEAGDVALEPAAGGNVVDLTVSAAAAEAGFVVPFRCRRLLATGTTISEALRVA